MRFWKVLNEDGTSCNGGDAQWSLPLAARPGAWMPVREVEPCVSGYHLCRDGDLLTWLGPRIWLAEGRGQCVEESDKVVFAEARLLRLTSWDDALARRFAALCAWRALCRERRAGREPDARSWESVRAAVAFSRGEIDAEKLAAARHAAWDAARYAASAAESAAAWAAVLDAAWAAAWAAAWDAASAAARDAERSAQTRILLRVLCASVGQSV